MYCNKKDLRNRWEQRAKGLEKIVGGLQGLEAGGEESCWVRDLRAEGVAALLLTDDRKERMKLFTNKVSRPCAHGTTGVFLVAYDEMRDVMS